MTNEEPSARAVFVTGANSGIGRATAVRFATAGAHVALVGRDSTRLDRVAKEINSIQSKAANPSETRCFPIVADVTIESEARRAVTETRERFGRLDVMVNAAGQLSSGDIESTTLDAWDSMMNVNLRAVFHLMQLAVPHLREHKGNVVNVSSVTGLRAFPNVLAYCVSKAALDQLTRCAALELAADGVRVNAVNPGVVKTGLHLRSGMNEPDYAAFLERSGATHPLGRTGNAEEVAELIFYLASEHASWITGATYSIDGGRAQTCAR